MNCPVHMGAAMQPTRAAAPIFVSGVRKYSPRRDAESRRRKILRCSVPGCFRVALIPGQATALEEAGSGWMFKEE